MGAMIFGIISAALAAFQGFSQSQRQISQAQNQARVMAANAQVTRQNAAMESERNLQEARLQEKEKIRLRNQFNETESANRVSLGAGNVDMSSGSALDLSLGNIDAFAADMGENAYAVALKKWEAAERKRIGEEQAHIMDENASWLAQSSGNTLTSLLTAGIGGFGGFTQGYSSAGGNLGKLFGGK